MQTFRLEPGPVTLYAQVAGILREHIRSGAWPNGEGIPTLEELAIQFNVARVTVRQAMQMLIQEGLVSSQRGRRSFVTYKAPVDRNPLFASINLISSISPDYATTIISRDEVPASYIEAPFMGVPNGPYMRVRKVDDESGTPYSTSTNFVSLPVYKRFPKNAEDQVKIARLVRDKARAALTECRERIMSVPQTWRSRNCCKPISPRPLRACAASSPTPGTTSCSMARALIAATASVSNATSPRKSRADRPCGTSRLLALHHFRPGGISWSGLARACAIDSGCYNGISIVLILGYQGGFAPGHSRAQSARTSTT